MAVSKSKGIARIKARVIHVKDANPQCKVLVYGRNGHGKTRFAASGPKTIILDVNEKGTRSVRSYDAHMVPIDKWEELTFAYWWLKAGDHDFQTVVVDTLTQAQQMCMAHILREAEDRDPNRPASMPRRQDWGQLGELMKPLILNFRNLPLNVVFVCQERIDKSGEDEEETTNRRVPDLSPSVRGIAMASVEVMGRIYKRKVRTVNPKTKKETSQWQTRMLVGPHEDYETKDRTGVLGNILVNPTMEHIIKASFETEDE